MELIKEIDEDFIFNDTVIKIIGDYENPWFITRDICNILCIKDNRSALRSIPEKWKDEQILPTNGGRQSTSIINEAGLYRLVMRSNKPIALKFQEFVCEDILPTIRKTGEYKLKQLSEKNKELQKELTSKENELASKENELALKEKELELSWLTKFNKKSVVYIGFIGIIEDKNYYKFGWTDDIQRRSTDHKNDYGTFNLQYVLECNQNIILEQKLKDHKEIKKVRCSRIFKEKNRTELIVLNNEFTIEKVKTILKKLKTTIDENEYISIKHKEKIMEFELEIIKEQTKQKELVLKYSSQTKDNEHKLEHKLEHKEEHKEEHKLEHKLEHKEEHNNCQIEFILDDNYEEEIEFVIEDEDDIEEECSILRKCNICNIDKKLTKFSKCININTYRLTCKECINKNKEMEKAKIKYTKIKGVKHFWSQEETEILLKAVSTYGTKWAKILKNNPILIQNNRTNVDLKDKYRNILKTKNILSMKVLSI